MTLNELNSFYTSLIRNITTEENNISGPGLLEYVLPLLNSSRLIESEEVTLAYYQLERDNVKVDAYLINESGERLQLFLSNLVLPNSNDIQVTRKDYYESLFVRAKNFFLRSVKGQLKDVQESDPAAVIIRALETAVFQDQIDVVEIFLVSNTISIEPRGVQSLKTFLFDDDEIKVSYNYNGKRREKSFQLKYQLIDLNKIYDFEVSGGNSEPIVIDFDPALTAIKAAADDGLFESYLAVIPAKVLVQFYHDYSSRLLERNVRSFLQFKGVNKQIKETISLEPEKFIAYNNGLTITATASDIAIDGGAAKIKSLTDFQIVNGGQTTASIYFTAKEGIDISKVNVTAKINVVNSEDIESLDELISKISQFSNSQNKVSSVDLNSRSAHLVRIKKLSESISDPAGSKWFFERIRGEFNTLLRIYPKQRLQIERNYPKNKRLSKEQLAKYFVAWGLTPYLVRKGGEKVFRDFMSLIQFDQSGKAISPESLDRSFYEDLISKAILFKEFESIYGSGVNAIGQIRSSVVPYALSLLYKMTLQKKSNYFNLAIIWSEQKLPEDLRGFSKELLTLVHEWCKKYSKSDDVGEYAKKEELWNDILKSSEFLEFEKSRPTIGVLARYKLSEEAYRKRYIYSDVFDFTLINETCRIHSNGERFYKSVIMNFLNRITPGEQRAIEDIIHRIQIKQNLSAELIESEDRVIKKLQASDPDWFLGFDLEANNLIDAVNKVIKVYNKNLSRVKEAFEAETVKLQKKGIEDYLANGWANVGKSIFSKEIPEIKDIYKIAELIK